MQPDLFYLPIERMEDKEVIAIQYRKISELEEENKSLKEENNRLKNNAMEDMRVQTKLEEENKKLKEEKELLKQCLDKLMFDADVVNVKIHWELWDYVYVRSDKQFKLDVKE